MMPVKIREGAMGMLEVKSVPNLLGPRYPPPMRSRPACGSFLTGHEAFDFESGIPRRWLVHRARCLGGGAADARAISFCSESGARSSGPTWANGFRFETWVR